MTAPLHYVCATCGTQYPASDSRPASCPICLDERQYLPPGGQRWTTLDVVRSTHRVVVERPEPGLYGIGMTPEFAIGQRALLVRTPGGNVLWDCITLLDDATVEIVRALGGLSAIAISHPHYYTAMIEWAHAFGCPVYLHAADAEWVMRPDRSVEFWDGDTRALARGLTLIRCGGHFSGGTVLHWPAGAEGRGALLTGDIIQVIPDRRYVSFMRSYPNLVPLSAGAVERIAQAVEPYAYDRIYGAWWDRVIPGDAQAVVARSVQRYIAALRDDPDSVRIRPSE